MNLLLYFLYYGVPIMKIILKKGLIVLLASLFATSVLAAQSATTPQQQKTSAQTGKNKKQLAANTKQCSKNKKNKKTYKKK